LAKRKSKPTGKLKQGQHRSTHPWEAGWNGHSPFGNNDVLPDSQRLGLGTRPCKTLADMTPEERAAIEAEYGAKIVGG
jgi:hypothetical protein